MEKYTTANHIMLLFAQCKYKSSSKIRRTFNAYGPALPFNNAPCDYKAESTTSCFPGGGTVDLIKFIENLVKMVGCNPNAGILNSHLQKIIEFNR